MKQIIALYRGTLNENIKELKHILEEIIKINDPQIHVQLEILLNKTCENLLAKWMSGRKYVRTHFVKQAIPNYPIEVLKLSVSLDAIINLLDEILDEELTKEDKALHLIELIRIFAIYSYQNYSEPIRNAIWNYVNKIISIAVLEAIYTKLIQNETSIDKLVEYSLQIYNCRSLDIDIYIEIPLLVLQSNAQDKILHIGRLFRAVNLIKKDIGDVEHDKKNRVKSVITLLTDKKCLIPVLEKIIETYTNLAKQILSENKSVTPIKNFYNMMEEEIAKIKILIKY